MAKAVEWVKIKIKSLELTWSDFFLALGFVCFVPFAALSWLFMVTWDPTEIAFKPWMMITCFSISAISWGFYFYIEIKKGNIKNNFFTWAFVFFLIFSMVSVLVQPAHSSIDVEVKRATPLTWSFYGEGIKEGDIVNVKLEIPGPHKLFFCFASMLITTFVYIALMVFPKRLKSLKFLIFVGICIFGFLLILATYSYITEAEKYPRFIKLFFAGDFETIQNSNSIYSFIAHRVPYGACMMLGFIYVLVMHSITKNNYLFIASVFFYINMIFSYCKTALSLSLLIYLLYFIFLLVVGYKDYKKRNLTILICIGSFLLIGLVIVSISLLTKGAFLPLIYKVFVSLTNSETLNTRRYIWGNINLLLKDGWWIIGRGFGTYNHILYPMNILNGDNVCPSHSSYYAVLGAGGIFNLLGFLGLYIYFGYVFYKCFKVDKILTIKLSFGFLVFLLYSFTEGVNYLIVFFTIPLLFYYSLIKNGYVSKEE